MIVKAFTNVIPTEEIDHMSLTPAERIELTVTYPGLTFVQPTRVVNHSKECVMILRTW